MREKIAEWNAVIQRDENKRFVYIYIYIEARADFFDSWAIGDDTDPYRMDQ